MEWHSGQLFWGAFSKFWGTIISRRKSWTPSSVNSQIRQRRTARPACIMAACRVRIPLPLQCRESFYCMCRGHIRCWTRKLDVWRATDLDQILIHIRSAGRNLSFVGRLGGSVGRSFLCVLLPVVGKNIGKKNQPFVSNTRPVLLVSCRYRSRAEGQELQAANGCVWK